MDKEIVLSKFQDLKQLAFTSRRLQGICLSLIFSVFILVLWPNSQVGLLEEGQVAEINLQSLPLDGEFALAQSQNTDSDTVVPLEGRQEIAQELASALDNQAIGEAFVAQWSDITIQEGDTLSKVLTRLGVNQDNLGHILKQDKRASTFTQLHPGQSLRVKQGLHGEIVGLAKDLSLSETFILEENEKRHFQGRIEPSNLNSRLTFKEGVIDDSLFLAAKKSGVSDRLIMTLADLFAWDVDFSLDIRPGDRFKVLYKEYYKEGRYQGHGPIIAAEFVNRGKVYRAIRYEGKPGKVRYYAPDGMSLKKAFLRSPVKFTRISSHFNLKRHHPILHKIRAHRGVDFSAPSGTPIRASGHGKVTFVGQKSGYGNVIEIQHGQRYSTLYAHLSRFESSLKMGQKIDQGQIIGYVGKTGLATAPHLHYEFRVDGKHQDPMTVKLPKSEPIKLAYKTEFEIFSKPLLALLENPDAAIMASYDQ